MNQRKVCKWTERLKTKLSSADDDVRLGDMSTTLSGTTEESVLP